MSKGSNELRRQRRKEIENLPLDDVLRRQLETEKPLTWAGIGLVTLSIGDLVQSIFTQTTFSETIMSGAGVFQSYAVNFLGVVFGGIAWAAGYDTVERVSDGYETRERELDWARSRNPAYAAERLGIPYIGTPESEELAA